MERTDKSLKFTMKYIEAFSRISGLNCNVDKTKVIPIGSFDMINKICPDIDLEWQEDFTLLGFYIDNKLEKLRKNLDIIQVKVTNLIKNGRDITSQSMAE